MLFSLFYEIILILLALVSLPSFLFQLIFKKKYRNNILQRLGCKFPQIEKSGRRLIWIHAVSVGETKAISSFVKRIKAEPNPPVILFSNTTETGHSEACQTIKADYHVYLPFDFGWIIKRIVKKVSPDLVILCESDFWVNFLHTAKRIGAQIAVINGKISERSAKRLAKWPTFASKLFSPVDFFCIQNQLYLDRFVQLGVLKPKCMISGNIKFDSEYPSMPERELIEWQKRLGITPDDLVIVAGSSHHGEESLIMRIFTSLSKDFPTAKLLIVPRHPERFDEVGRLLSTGSVSFSRLSQNNANPQTKIILIDAMGHLRQMYQLADIAIVCGSFVKNIGGHNILEPSWYGVPVLFGPYMHNQPELVDLVLENEAGLQVDGSLLPSVLSELLSDQEKRNRLGSHGVQLTSKIHGATAKTILFLKEKAFL